MINFYFEFHESGLYKFEEDYVKYYIYIKSLLNSLNVNTLLYRRTPCILDKLKFIQFNFLSSTKLKNYKRIIKKFTKNGLKNYQKYVDKIIF